MVNLVNLPVAVIAYLIGSISFAVVVSTIMGLSDPRTYGSKNPGVTNVLRSGKKVAAVLTLFGDAFKGWITVWIVKHYGAAYWLDAFSVAMVSLSVFLGHLYPVFFCFQGGKGVATAAGVLLAIEPVLGISISAIWLIIVFVFRYASLAALITVLLTPFFYLFICGYNSIAVAIISMGILLIWRHRSNINNLLARRESRIGDKKDKIIHGSDSSPC
ncbi:glycerol-3-phosphate 1-O-acyltransferase PlsY [Candidatus Vallotia lariciata]|uniref:glycerol-3-phosphate 1-O-acyltransferase PlsY n=1 Tax=Candidatus Vallotia laricis TaxID=2018052 RepID=UPI001D01F462|nr:glycerol-3-phosphate 1-O-acyltransferase PlsY [Candidatus Vallotia lariciata]UDG82863.1 putative glycerol-3-phosphate acyltransferase [Candidatus Vallotia lariciata]